MKVKDIERTANVAWSPKTYHPVHIAVGTAAQQLDASFSTNASLELYTLNITEPGQDTSLVSSVSSDQRFHKLIWGSHGADNSGTIIGGCDAGLIKIYDASRLLKGEEGLVGKQEKHTGPVHALDFNNFQRNLFATAAGNSEIFIWDLNNTSTPMSPGTKTQPLEDILSVSWNKQVQHILASAFPSKCVIWDLRKNEPIIKITDTISRIRWKVVTWHPEVATQLCLASEEDQSPVIQLWDLRFATSPLKTLEQHQRGVLSVAWCSDDPDLLVSCAKDNRILCWNPNSNAQTGEVLAEIAKTNQWSFDVAWCPRNPALIASPNFDGHVSIYSLMGGKTQQIQTTNKIADSFPGMDGYVQAPVPQQSLAPVRVDLTKPPKWLKRPVGAKFGFGGKLVTFDHEKEAVQNTQPNQTPLRRSVYISQVVTQPDLVQKSEELEKALSSENFIEYCMNKSEVVDDQHKKYLWHFIKANFEQNPRAELLNLLGYNIEDVNNKLNEKVGDELKNNIEVLSNDFENMNRLDDFPVSESNVEKKKPKVTTPFKIKTGDDTDGIITQALLLNNVEAAVGLCLKAKRFADALVIATTGGDELLARTQHKYLEQSEGYVASLISAVLSEDWASLINSCDVNSWKEALAAILTHSNDDDLPYYCELLGNKLEKEGANDRKLLESAQLCYICAGSFDKLVTSWSDEITMSTERLQELVELVTFLQKSIERRGGRVQVSGALAKFLSHYASLLAAQGSLATAVNYLGSSTDEKVISLRERLYVALGQQSKPEARQQVGRRGSHRQSFSSSYPTASNLFAPSTNPFQTPLQPQPDPIPVNPAQFNTNLPNPPLPNNPWQPQPPPHIESNFNQHPPKTFSPAPPPVHPPRPTSVGSSHGGSSGLPSKKYVLDPSVSSNQYGMPLKSQYQPPLNPQQPFNTFTPNVPMSSTPASNFSPAPTNVYNNTPNFNRMHSANNSGYGNLPPPPAAAEPYENAQPALSHNAPSGWNDPPPLSSTSLKSKPEIPSADPITHPMYGVAPAQSLPTNGYMDQSNQPMSSPYTPQIYQPPAPPTNNFNPGFNPSNFNQDATMTNRRSEVSARTESPQPVEKGPIPEEHMHLKTVFDELKVQCICVASNPQTRRKLEDVGKKLELLYDMLRENKLSPNTITSLHQLIGMIQNGDYQSGLNLHTQLVSGPDFSQIASFMPGVKVLLQCAIQLNVYIVR